MKLRFITSLCMVFMFFMNLNAQNTVEKHGRLQTNGNRIVDKNDSIVSFAGMSMFWSNWAGDFYNAEVVNWLMTDWDAKIMRAAMGIEGNSSGAGYLDAPEVEKDKIKTIVDACIAEGIYVIIDWHDHYAHKHEDEAVAFFAEMSAMYGAYDNVIYEIYNEPLYVEPEMEDLSGSQQKFASWDNEIKPYAENVIAAIRANDPDNLIVVGTPSWSQKVSDVIGNEIVDTNVAYVMHFYVGMHDQWLRTETKKALDADLPIFVTEWGVWGDEGDWSNWMDFMKDNKLSHCNWSVNDKVEPSSPLVFGVSKTGGWTEDELTPVGKNVRNYMIYWDSIQTPALPTPPCDVFNIKGKLQVENFCTQEGVQIEDCSEGGKNVGYINSGDWMEYKVKVLQTDSITIDYRVGGTGNGKLSLQLIDSLGNSTVISEVEWTATNDWQDWKTVAQHAYIVEGEYTLRLTAKSKDWNLNYINFGSKYDIVGVNSNPHNTLRIYPNPAKEQLTVSCSAIDYKVEIINLNGEILATQNKLNGNYTFSILDLLPGIYMVKTTSQQMTGSKMLVVK